MSNRTPHRRAAALLAVGMALLTAAGCGGGSGSGGHPLSVATLTLRANAICNALVTKETTTRYPATEAGAGRKIADVEAMVARLRKLTPPASEKAQYDDMIASFQRGSAYYKANLHKIFQVEARLKANPNDSKAASESTAIGNRLTALLHPATVDATNLALPECVSALAGGSKGTAP